MSFANFILGLMGTISALLVLKGIIFMYSLCNYKSKLTRRKMAAREKRSSQGATTEASVIDVPPNKNNPPFKQSDGFGQPYYSYGQNPETTRSSMNLPCQHLSEIRVHDGQLVLVFARDRDRDEIMKTMKPPPPYSA